LVSRNRNGHDDLRFNDFVEYDSSLGLVKNYYVGASLVARRDGAGLKFSHPDVSDSVRARTNSSGALVASYDYTPFGDRLPSPALTGITVGFSGARTDSDNGLTEMGDRAYDARLGVFTSADTRIPDPLHPAALN